MPWGPDCAAKLFFRVPACSFGTSRRRDKVAQSLEMRSAGPIDGALKSGVSHDGAPVIRSWGSISEMEWAIAEPAEYWVRGEIDWGFPQVFALPRIAREKLHWSNFQFIRTQAIIHLPDVSQSTAQLA